MTLIYNNHHRYRYDIICITQLFITNLLYTNIIIYSFFLIKIVMLEYYFFWTTSFSVPCFALPPEDLAFFNQVSLQKIGAKPFNLLHGQLFLLVFEQRSHMRQTQIQEILCKFKSPGSYS